MSGAMSQVSSPTPRNGSLPRSLRTSSSDGEMLSAFLKQQDEAAFAAIVQRHGQMVFGVALRIVRDLHAAEDVTQATFLVLATEARRIRRRQALSCWLHGVAMRLAKKALRRRNREHPTDTVDELAVAENPFDSLHSAFEQQVLDEELRHLPAHYRDALILHFLEGKTYEETAECLGVTLGTIEGRMKRGKRELQLRLTKRGVGLPAALLALNWSHDAAALAISPHLTHTITENAVAAFHETAFVTSCSPEAVYLAGKKAAMLTTTRIAMLACGLFLAVGTGWLSHAGWAAPQAPASGSQPSALNTELAQFQGGLSGEAQDRGILRGQKSMPAEFGEAKAEQLGLTEPAESPARSAETPPAATTPAAGTSPKLQQALASLRQIQQALQTLRSLHPQDPDLAQQLDQVELAIGSLYAHIKTPQPPTAPAESGMSHVMGEYGADGYGQEMGLGVASTPQAGAEYGASTEADMYGEFGYGMSGMMTSPDVVSVERSESPALAKITQALKLPNPQFDFVDAPLNEVADALGASLNITIRIDKPALSEEGLDPDLPITFALQEGITETRDLLDLMLEQVELAYLVRNGCLVITSEVAASDYLVTRVYNVRPLQVTDPESLADVIAHSTSGEWMYEDGAGGEISFFNGSFVIRQTQQVHREIETLLNQLARQIQTSAKAPQWPTRERAVFQGNQADSPLDGGGFF